jgi:hypothetical protein
MQALVDAGYIVPGNVAGSKFFSLLEFQSGPMFRVFTEQEIRLWKDWANSLVATPNPVPVNSVDSMISLIKTLKNQQTGNAQHKAIQLLQPDTDSGHPISWWFNQDPVEFMAALRYKKNNLITPYDPDNSVFITRLIAPENAMGQAYSFVIPGTGNQTGRDIVINWINDGCPLQIAGKELVNVLAMPGGKEKIYLSSSLKKRKSLSQKIHGMGAIH